MKTIVMFLIATTIAFPQEKKFKEYKQSFEPGGERAGDEVVRVYQDKIINKRRRDKTMKWEVDTVTAKSISKKLFLSNDTLWVGNDGSTCYIKDTCYVFSQGEIYYIRYPIDLKSVIGSWSEFDIGTSMPYYKLELSAIKLKYPDYYSKWFKK